VFVNLIDKQGDQGRLGQLLKNALAKFAVLKRRWLAGEEASMEDASPISLGDGASSPLGHVWFDFHRECAKKRGGWVNLRKLEEQVQDDLGNHGFFALPGRDEKPVRMQAGVMRTNCVDCLDRTNVVQTLFARRILQEQLEHLGADTDGGTKGSALPKWLEQPFRDAWSENADAISLMYAGTPALKGDFTRKGRRTKTGLLKDGMNSAQRYWLNHFIDPHRQLAIFLFIHGELSEGVADGGSDSESKDRNEGTGALLSAEVEGDPRPAKILALTAGCILVSLLVPLVVPGGVIHS